MSSLWENFKSLSGPILIYHRLHLLCRPYTVPMLLPKDTRWQKYSCSKRLGHLVSASGAIVCPSGVIVCPSGVHRERSCIHREWSCVHREWSRVQRINFIGFGSKFVCPPKIFGCQKIARWTHEGPWSCWLRVCIVCPSGHSWVHRVSIGSHRECATPSSCVHRGQIEIYTPDGHTKETRRKHEASRWQRDGYRWTHEFVMPSRVHRVAIFWAYDGHANIHYFSFLWHPNELRNVVTTDTKQQNASFVFLILI